MEGSRAPYKIVSFFFAWPFEAWWLFKHPNKVGTHHLQVAMLR